MFDSGWTVVFPRMLYKMLNIITEFLMVIVSHYMAMLLYLSNHLLNINTFERACSYIFKIIYFSIQCLIRMYLRYICLCFPARLLSSWSNLHCSSQNQHRHLLNPMLKATAKCAMTPINILILNEDTYLNIQYIINKELLLS